MGQTMAPPFVVAPPSTKRPALDRGHVLPPGKSEPQGKDDETPSQRRMRLEEAGIVAPLPKRTRVVRGWEKFAQALNPAAEGKDDTPLPVGFRTDVTLGSWFTLRTPKGVRYIPDFSTGFSLLMPVSNQRRDESGWFHSSFAGPSAVFYNGGTFARVPDRYNQKTEVYADTNVLEAGATYVLAQETRLSPFHLFAVEARLTYAPMRMVRARYLSVGQTPGRSEVGSHTSFNWSGVGVGLAGMMHVVRTVGAGLFAEISLARPSQAKLRLGVQIALTSTKPLPVVETEESLPVREPAVSEALKGTRFYKETPEGSATDAEAKDATDEGAKDAKAKEMKEASP